MSEGDPIKRVETLVEEMHTKIGRFTRPVLDRYPLLFTFLLTFSVAATFHGFELVLQSYRIFQNHPILLLGLGILGLFLTGSLYKGLRK